MMFYVAGYIWRNYRLERVWVEKMRHAQAFFSATYKYRSEKLWVMQCSDADPPEHYYLYYINEEDNGESTESSTS